MSEWIGIKMSWSRALVRDHSGSIGWGVRVGVPSPLVPGVP